MNPNPNSFLAIEALWAWLHNDFEGRTATVYVGLGRCSTVANFHLVRFKQPADPVVSQRRSPFVSLARNKSGLGLKVYSPSQIT